MVEMSHDAEVTVQILSIAKSFALVAVPVARILSLASATKAERFNVRAER